MEIDLAAVITAIGAIVAAWLGYNQYTKNKETDYKIEKLKTEDKEKNRRRADHSMIVYGELWSLLIELKADRGYIIQPHPLGHEELISIYFEVKHGGIEGMKNTIRNIKIENIGTFSADLAKNSFMCIKDINNDVKDKYVQSIMAQSGSETIVIKRLSNNEHKWIGNIFCEFLDKQELDEKDVYEKMKNAAIKIQYILPEYKE